MQSWCTIWSSQIVIVGERQQSIVLLAVSAAPQDAEYAVEMLIIRKIKCLLINLCREIWCRTARGKKTEGANSSSLRKCVTIRDGAWLKVPASAPLIHVALIETDCMPVCPTEQLPPLLPGILSSPTIVFSGGLSSGPQRLDNVLCFSQGLIHYLITSV